VPMTWLARGLVRGGMAIVSAVLLAVHLALLIPGFGLGLLFLIPWPFVRMRPVTGLARRLAGGVPAPYLPKPPPPTPEPDGRYRQDRQLYKRAWWPRAARYLEWVVGDSSTWRDLGWMFANPVVGTVLGFGPLAVMAGGVALGVARPAPLGWWWIPIGALVFAAGAAVGPLAVRTHDAWTRRVLGPPPPAGAGSVKAWIFGRSVTLFRLLVLAGTTVAATVYGVVLVVLAGLFAIGVVFFFPGAAENVRWLTNLRRRLAGEWSGVPIEVPYRPAPPLPPRRPDGLYEVDDHLYKTPHWTRYVQRLDWIWRDPATWRDLLWTVLDPVVGGVLAFGTLGAVLLGFVEQVVPTVLEATGAPDIDPPLLLAGRPWAAFALGVAMMAFGFVASPAVLRLHGRWTAWLLAPTEKARLDLRVRQLTESRDDANELQAAELRRIERDLHDGAQARLVAVGITLGLIDSLIDKDPAAARRLVAEARESSAKALSELRDLVRGVHPPVLQERGLGDAVRALALDAAIPTTVEIDLPGRLPAPIEAAAYFAVSEALTNAAKHSGATRVSVELTYDGRALYATVRDDGRGGADPARGSGLRGMRHRLAAFDGNVRVSSPSGGPTVVTLEVPCASSSPRTSTS
jgi:signal transduction histidine kinase